jgi:hypothetical protein
MKMFAAFLYKSFALDLYMEKSTKITKSKTITQITKIIFFFSTHTYRVIQNNLNICVNLVCGFEIR